MTGTLPSIPLAQNFDENGLPQSGCRLFVYAANTSTPVITYKDYLMTPGAEHSWPITADAMGRIPMFFLPDGFYRARLEERDGAPIYDEPQLPALSTGDGGGGLGPDPITQWSTGDFLWQPVAGPRNGWVRANARTIGNAVSGASERAHADCANLFAFLWNNYPDAWCQVIPGGRGANGPADFNNNKQIALLDMRGFTNMGLDGMGNAASGRYAGVPLGAGGAYDVAGSWIGANSQVMSAAQMPYHAHNATTALNIELHDPGHIHEYEDTFPSADPGVGIFPIGGPATQIGHTKTTGNAAANIGGPGTGITVNSSASTIIDPAGGNASQNNVPYVILGSWFVRL